MIAISNLKLAPGADEAQLRALAARALNVPPQDITALRIRKKSLDARRKDDIHYVYTVGVTVRGDERKLVRRCRGAAIVQDKTYPIPRIAPPQTRPVIVGFGPAGMFAALLLARAGARPIVLERGPDAQTRSAQIAAFRAGGPFDPECNVQFGEGGAGTFSDGKLNTGTHDARIGFVLAEFAAHGAPEHITYDAKPHIGTDVLVEVVQNLRREIIERGGEVRFGHRVTGLSTEDGHIAALTVAGPAGSYTLPARQVILAIGHSARDTFEMLHAQGVPMEPKPFSMGVRIEHRQADINAAQYGAGRLPTMRRIEQEGYVWARKGLLSLTSANDYLNALHAREQKYPAYMAVLQLGERKPSPSEEKYLAAWVDMGFPAETVALAYDKTVLRCHEFKWAYCNGILKRWHEKGLHTPAETAAENAAPKKEEKPSGGKNDWMKQYL